MEEEKSLAVRQENSGLPVLPIDQISNGLSQIQELKEKVLIKDVDYGKVPGVDKPTLLKPGMEKLAMMFNLAPEYVVQKEESDYDRQWTYTFWDKYKKQSITKTATGFHARTVLCRLVNKSTGHIHSSGLGECCSRERGRESAPPNTILKMACKRALGLAVQNGTMSSHLFTVDVEDYHREPIDVESEVVDDSGKTDSNIEAEMASKYSGSGCNFCGKKHIEKDEIIVKVNGKWGSKDCYLKSKAATIKANEGIEVDPNTGEIKEPPIDNDELPFDNMEEPAKPVDYPENPDRAITQDEREIISALLSGKEFKTQAAAKLKLEALTLLRVGGTSAKAEDIAKKLDLLPTIGKK